jgi:hypothetical protein
MSPGRATRRSVLDGPALTKNGSRRSHGRHMSPTMRASGSLTKPLPTNRSLACAPWTESYRVGPELVRFLLLRHQRPSTPSGAGSAPTQP